MNKGLLKIGDTIALAATARFISSDDLQYAIVLLNAMGFKVKVAANILLQNNQFAGTDLERASAFNLLLADNEIKAILMVRGGYGTTRIIDKIDFSLLEKFPKLICGFSDVTVLHSHIHQTLGIKTLHCEMPINFGNIDKSESIEKLNYILLESNTLDYAIQPDDFNKLGTAKGLLVGGNLSILYSLIGSKSDLNTDNKILFLEDIDEYLYHIDRMIIALKRAKKFNKLKGLVIGGFSDMKDNTIPFGKTAQQIILEHMQEFNFPIIFNFPAGHTNKNFPLLFGGQYLLIASNSEVSLTIV